MTKKLAWLAVVAIAVICVALLWWRQRELESRETASVPMPAPVAQEPKGSRASAPAASASAPTHPIEAASGDTSAANAAPLKVEDALIDLFGREAVLSMFQLDDLPRRLVATVDNLGRSSATARLWPVNPTPGRFTVETRMDAIVISADNGLRYTPFVLMIESVDMRRAAAVYRRLYPQIQKAYEDIGFPNQYFNDRLVEVIDLLLATPVVDTPLKVVLPPIHGPERPERPWVLYEFDAPELQGLTAGQKILLRAGPVNARRLRTKLTELRGLVTHAPASR